MIKPHGGCLVVRVLPEREKKSILERAEELPFLVVEEDTLLDLENITTGAFSPLRGFMTSEELYPVVYEMKLPGGPVWSVPVLLQRRERPDLPAGEHVLIKDGKGNPIAVMEVKEVYRIDLPEVAKVVWGTDSDEHPGVRKFYSGGEWAVGGEVWLLNKPYLPLRNWILEPSETRKIFEFRGWKKVIGFQTRNAPHRAHEYLQRLGLEMGDGLFIHPILGWKKSDDFSSEVVLKAYELLISRYYPRGRVLLSGLATSMRYAGPREAVFHAIVRKNFGCTHFIVGRDHAGVGDFYDPYAAHRIFDELPGDIGIEIVKVTSVFYCKRCGTMASDKSCGHGKEDRVYVSMTRVRKLLREGKIPPLEVIREDIADLLRREFSPVEA